MFPKVNEVILRKYKTQHNKNTETTHWHTGIANNAAPRNNIPTQLLPTNLIKQPLSKILYKLLEYEFSFNNYPLAGGLAKKGFIDPCLKLYPLQNLNSNNLIAKSYAKTQQNENFTISIFFTNLGYGLTMKGQSKVISYNTSLGNLPLPEDVYLLQPTVIQFHYYDFPLKSLEKITKTFN
jgi:hypothetical protein